MATTITNTMLGGLRQHIVDMASYGRYMIDDEWERSEIVTKEVSQNNAVLISFYVHSKNGSASPATKFQLMDENNNVLAERIEELAFTEYYNTLLYRFKFGVNVGENN